MSWEDLLSWLYRFCDHTYFHFWKFNRSHKWKSYELDCFLSLSASRQRITASSCFWAISLRICCLWSSIWRALYSSILSCVFILYISSYESTCIFFSVFRKERILTIKSEIRSPSFRTKFKSFLSSKFLISPIRKFLVSNFKLPMFSFVSFSHKIKSIDLKFTITKSLSS